MLSTAARVYRETRKKHDQLFNTYFMRPLAAVVVAAVAPTQVTPNQLTLLNLALFVVAAALLVAFPTWAGGLAAVAVLELSYCFDCADGMLARFKKLASKTGHLFDFFTDELKAVAPRGGARGALVAIGRTRRRPPPLGARRLALPPRGHRRRRDRRVRHLADQLRPAARDLRARDDRRGVLRGRGTPCGECGRRAPPRSSPRS